ncbi:MAG TPA: hypothetical protein VEO54_29985 [Thermoanaerobaculia bacterium]|nr:hypothetical protein [Thermoanaerobaculia bacterium]
MKSLAFALLLFSTAAIEVNTSRLADGTTQTFLSGSRKVAVHKSGDTTTVMVQEGDRLDTVTLTRADGELSIGRKNNGVPRRFIVVDRPKVIVDGIDLEPHLMDEMTPAPQSVPAPGIVPLPKKFKPMMRDDTTYHVCPKDGTKVIVPPDAGPGPYRCPVDGTPLKSGVGPGSKFFLIE